MVILLILEILYHYHDIENHINIYIDKVHLATYIAR